MATPAQTLAQLLVPWTLDQVRSLNLASLQAQPGGLNVTDWNSGGWERSIVELDSIALHDLVAVLVPTLASTGFLDLALANAPQWVPLIVEEFYGLKQNAATYTQGNVKLTCAASAGPYTFAAGDVWVLSASGLRYVNITGGTLPSGGTLTLLFQSESPNNSPGGFNYAADGINTITTLVTQFAGVTVSNPGTPFSAATLTGLGTGTVTPSGSPSGSHSVTIRIDTSGQAGVASWSYSLDGGGYVSAGAVASALVGAGITATLTNGSLSPSFIAGDLYAFTAPGSWITQQGTDIESLDSLVARAKNRWPSLASLVAPNGVAALASPTLGFYDLLARAASTQVTQTLVATDATIPNQVNIVIAGQAGPLPTAVVNAVQGFFNAKQMITDKPVVSTTASRAITVGGTIKVRAAQLAAAQAAAQSKVATYVNSAGINGLIELAEVISAVMEVDGITNITGLTINGAAADLQLPVTPGAFESPQLSGTVAGSFTWTAV
jgi:hypothetical protein